MRTDGAGRAVLRDAQGRKLGRVVGEIDGQLVVEQGWFRPRDWVIPVESVQQAPGGYVLRDEAAALREWSPTEETVPGPEWAAGEEVEVPLHEEELVAEKQAVLRGHLRLTKRVITEERTIVVQVRREELRLERAPAAAHAAPASETEHEGILGAPLEEHEGWLPLYEEEVELVRRPKVREWIRISKSLVAEPKSYVSRVRRETADVEADPGVVTHLDG